ncbi:MAG TPA: sodium:calcium antiporter [Patescibacteria group bacterium]|nr:sodium:calcium antiporter [Patescibacteria group bacterium]
MLIHLIFFIGSFLILWFSANLIVDAISTLTKKISVSSFAVSFFILGILTSIPELSIGINSLINHTPALFIGNLIGASFVLYMLVIPLLALFGGGIRLSHEMSQKTIALSLFTAIAPFLLILDGRITRFEGFFITLMYVVLFYSIEKRKNLSEKIHDGIRIGGFKPRQIFDGKKGKAIYFVKIGIGILLLFGGSRVIVDQTNYFAHFFHIGPFFMSLLVLSIGTNLPELSIAFASLVKKNKDIAFGDYVGSAAANSLFFGILTVINGDFTLPIQGLYRTFVIFIVGLSLFFIFTRTKKSLSRWEGAVLLLIYVLFIAVEVGMG